MCSRGVSLTREELELLETLPRRLTCEDQKRRRVLKKRLRRAEMSPERRARENEASRHRQLRRRADPKTRAAENEKQRKRRAERSLETRASENEASRQRQVRRRAHLETRAAENERQRERRAERSQEKRASENDASREIAAKRVAELTLQARSAELKRKAEKEALRRAAMSRLESERVLQQQRVNAYRRRMNALSEGDRREMNEVRTQQCLHSSGEDGDESPTMDQKGQLQDVAIHGPVDGCDRQDVAARGPVASSSKPNALPLDHNVRQLFCGTVRCTCL